MNYVSSEKTHFWSYVHLFLLQSHKFNNAIENVDKFTMLYRFYQVDHIYLL